MSASVLIRVQLPDRPGALGAVASRIGALRGSVVSFDILERGGDRVVDELGVEVPDDHVHLLEQEILEVDGVVVEDIAVLEGPLLDAGDAVVDLAGELLRLGSPSEVLSRMAEGVHAFVRAEGTRLESAGEVVAALGAGCGEPDPGDVVTELASVGATLRVRRRVPHMRDREVRRIVTAAALADHRCAELAQRLAC